MGHKIKTVMNYSEINIDDGRCKGKGLKGSLIKACVMIGNCLELDN